MKTVHLLSLTLLAVALAASTGDLRANADGTIKRPNTSPRCTSTSPPRCPGFAEPLQQAGSVPIAERNISRSVR